MVFLYPSVVGGDSIVLVTVPIKWAHVRLTLCNWETFQLSRLICFNSWCIRESLSLASTWVSNFLSTNSGELLNGVGNNQMAWLSSSRICEDADNSQSFGLNTASIMENQKQHRKLAKRELGLYIVQLKYFPCKHGDLCLIYRTVVLNLP